MKTVFLIILSFISCSLSGQTKNKTQYTTIHTDSSTIYFQKDNRKYESEEVIKMSGRIQYKYFYVKDNILYKEGWKDSTGKLIGVWKTYSKKGEWLYSIYYPEELWIYNKPYYPYSDLLESIRSKGDTLIIQTYGNDFFEKHIRFNLHSSAIFVDTNSTVGWEEPVKEKPLKFSLVYDIRFDSAKLYGELVKFELDPSGYFFPFKGKHSYGFEQLPDSTPKTFSLTFNSALEIAKQNGLIENGTAKVATSLKFDSNDRDAFFDGEFHYYIMQLLRKEDFKKKLSDGTTYYYKAWIFNPWTSELIEIKEIEEKIEMLYF